jgi:hypothetical protein
VDVDHIVRKVPLDLDGQIFETDLDHYTKWSRDRCHPRDELDEVAQVRT